MSVIKDNNAVDNDEHGGEGDEQATIVKTGFVDKVQAQELAENGSREFRPLTLKDFKEIVKSVDQVDMIAIPDYLIPSLQHATRDSRLGVLDLVCRAVRLSIVISTFTQHLDKEGIPYHVQQSCATQKYTKEHAKKLIGAYINILEIDPADTKDTAEALTTFQLFKYLPEMFRRTIWDMAFCTEEIVEISATFRRYGYDYEPEQLTYLTTTNKINVASACKESFHQARKFLRAIVPLHPLLPLDNFVNLDFDIFWHKKPALDVLDMFPLNAWGAKRIAIPYTSLRWMCKFELWFEAYLTGIKIDELIIILSVEPEGMSNFRDNVGKVTLVEELTEDPAKWGRENFGLAAGNCRTWSDVSESLTDCLRNFMRSRAILREEKRAQLLRDGKSLAEMDSFRHLKDISGWHLPIISFREPRPRATKPT